MSEGNIIKTIWLIGISLSVISFLVQMMVLILMPKTRKLDLKILTQITVGMIINVSIEYTAVFHMNFEGWPLYVSMTMYVHTGCALTCWKFIFTKNLYDKVIQVFTPKTISFMWTSVLVWLVTLPVGIICPILYIINPEHVYIFVNVLFISMFVVLFVNLLFFCRIFYVVIRRKMSSNNFNGMLRICVILFVLVCMSSVIVLFMVLAIYCESWNMMRACFVINSYQVLAVMTIFVTLVRGSPTGNNSKSPPSRLESATSEV